jgi:hypothetical protein
MLVLSDGDLVVARRCGILGDANMGVLRRKECIMRGMERRRLSYRVSSPDEAVDIDRKGRALSRLVFCLLASNHVDYDEVLSGRWCGGDAVDSLEELMW